MSFHRTCKLGIVASVVVSIVAVNAPPSTQAAIDAGSIVSTLHQYDDVVNHPETTAPDLIRFAGGAVYEMRVVIGEPQYTMIHRRVIGHPAVLVAGADAAAAGDGGPAVNAYINAGDFVVAPDGTVYISDFATNTVRKVGADGVIRRFAGNGNPTASGDGGPALNAGLQVGALTLDAAGNLFVAGNQRIRKVGLDGVISTFVTLATPGAAVLETDAAGNVYGAYPSGFGLAGTTFSLFKVTANGALSPGYPAAPGLPANLVGLTHLFDVTPDGTMYLFLVEVASVTPHNDLIRIAPNGTVTTMRSVSTAGGSHRKNGALSQAEFEGRSIALSPEGDIYFTDFASDSEPSLRKITNAAPASAATPLQPTRILDTRPGAGQVGYAGDKPTAGATVSLQVAGRGGVPSTGAAAVTMNVTFTDTDGPGFVTAWPSGIDRPLSSNLNAEAANSTVANLVTVPIGADGRVNLFVQVGGQLIADVSGWLPPGVYVPKPPTRLLDTREGPGQTGYTGAKPAADGIVDLQITGVSGVPTDGVSAVVLNVTATEATAPGFVTVWPSGLTRPLASSLNLDSVGATAPNQVTVPVGANGKVSFYTQTGAHLLADLAGYYTVSTGYTPLTPARILETRPGPGQTGFTGVKPGPLATINVAVAGRGGVPATGAGAVILNVTATDATAPGFVTVWPGGTAQPNSSVLNLTYVGQTRPNAVLVPLGADGSINLFTQSGAHFIIDVAGWFPA